ncbi:MAG: glycosyltransferase [Paenibacillus sp.]|nr:glycosyltransferase [Paenibacillus sp.]
MKKKAFSRAAALIVATCLLSASVWAGTVAARTEGDEETVRRNETGGICWTEAKIGLKTTMQRLWMEQALWTQSYLVSAFAGLDDQKPVLERLLRNQQDIGDAIKPYYGEEAGNDLAELLKEHILIAGQIVTATQAGNGADARKYNKEWHRNADDIAKFLSAANPHWSYEELKASLEMRLALIAEVLEAMLAKDWEGSIEVFDKGEAHLIELADLLSEGIVKQFPDRFRSR